MRQEETEVSVKDSVDILYESEEKATYEALKSLLKDDPEIREKLAIFRYKNEDISVARAAKIAGVSFEDMKRILAKNGVEPRLGPETREEARQEHLNMRKILENVRNRK